MMRIGIFFGGVSREREISFAGGRTVYDNLDKSLFTPVPIFIDSFGNMILLDWQYLYKGTVRDFYPPVAHLPESPHQFQVYIESLENLADTELQDLIAKVGKPVAIADLPNLIDFGFLALHGELGEDGQIQGLLDSLHIPYSGSGIRASSIGMDKGFQKKLMEAGGFHTPNMQIYARQQWLTQRPKDWKNTIAQNIGYPLVVRPANQGSSIGVSIVHSADTIEQAIDAAFFTETLTAKDWNAKNFSEQIAYVQELTDIRTGLGFPLILEKEGKETTYYHPENLLSDLDNLFDEGTTKVTLYSLQSEQHAVAEEFINGREFSCVVLRNEDGQATALPPTEILKGQEVFDYRSKYLAGLSRKRTPIDLPQPEIERICQECERLYSYLEFNTYARIDGFIQEDGKIFLNDPNTTSGMLPSSFFFHQAAEIGLNPSQFLTYIIRTSLEERIQTSSRLRLYDHLLEDLDKALVAQQQAKVEKKTIAVFLGGYSSERHISVESGRNIYEKLASSSKYMPIPVFVMKDGDNHRLYQIPINLLLKDNADDIKDKILHYSKHPIIDRIQKDCKNITARYTTANPIFEPKELDYNTLSNLVDGVFIALHGRPGEDGEVQKRLQQLGVPFNGSQASSAQLTINKYNTLQELKKNGFSVTDQHLVYQEDFKQDIAQQLDEIEKVLGYPFIAKPVDDGCSSAVKLIKTRAQLQAFLEAIFRAEELIDSDVAAILNLKPKEEFPQKVVALLEALITQEDAAHFLEITGGLLTKYTDNGELEYELFEPSEALASGEVLSLEEKFLAGEGQNITPARFVGNTDLEHQQISSQVRQTLEAAAKVLKVTGYARIDAFVRIYEDGRADTIVIEVNSLPGMTPATCIFHQCAINGYKPFEFIDSILEFGFERQERTKVLG
ncbi:MAG: D-alanine--D-alanine ligase [Aureispira sp.]|nr:D-alanine--D-alanine ligase [Aureispira sp.]